MIIDKFQRKDFINLHFDRMQSWYRRRCLGSSFHARITKTRGRFVPGGHERLLIQGHSQDKAYCIHASGSHTGLTMSQIKMRVHAHAEFCLMPTVTIFETRGNVLDVRSTIGWSWRTAGRVAEPVDPERANPHREITIVSYVDTQEYRASTRHRRISSTWSSRDSCLNQPILAPSVLLLSQSPISFLVSDIALWIRWWYLKIRCLIVILIIFLFADENLFEFLWWEKIKVLNKA